MQVRQRELISYLKLCNYSPLARAGHCCPIMSLNTFSRFNVVHGMLLGTIKLDQMKICYILIYKCTEPEDVLVVPIWFIIYPSTSKCFKLNLPYLWIISWNFTCIIIMQRISITVISR